MQLLVQSEPITTKVVSSNPVHGEVYSIKHYAIKFVGDLSVVYSINKTDRQEITEIVLKVTLDFKLSTIIIWYDIVYLIIWTVNKCKEAYLILFVFIYISLYQPIVVYVFVLFVSWHLSILAVNQILLYDIVLMPIYILALTCQLNNSIW